MSQYVGVDALGVGGKPDARCPVSDHYARLVVERFGAGASSWARNPGVGVVKTLLRVVIRDPDVADALGDLAGIDVRGGAPRSLARKSATLMRETSEHEYKVSPADRTIAESKVAEALQAAAKGLSNSLDRREVALAVAQGSTALRALLEPFESAGKGGKPWWGMNEAMGEYYLALMNLAAAMICDWARSDPDARERAILAAGSETLRAAGSIADRLVRIESVLSSIDSTIQTLARQNRTPRADPAFIVLVDALDPLQVVRAGWVRDVIIAAGGGVLTKPFAGNVPRPQNALSDNEVYLFPSGSSTPSFTDMPETQPIVVVFGQDEAPVQGEHLRVPDSSDGARHLLAQLRATLARVNLALIDEQPRVGVDPGSVLPRLRQLTQEAIAEAGSIGGLQLGDPSGRKRALYVRRDLQEVVVDRLNSTARIVVVGEAGVGKTSLLWGIADQLADRTGPENVYFVPAGHLVPNRQREALVLPEDLVTAVREQIVHGHEPVVLIDTADLLVNDVSSLLVLVQTLNRLTECGGRTVVTSRPQEATRIVSDGSSLLRLEPYSTAVSGVGVSSEFVRAVASHAVTYCRRPGDANDMADQIRDAAIRENSLGEMARTPLLLRMLFELYTPDLIPADVEATLLFERYWQSRIVTDTRSWADRADQDATIDTSTTVKNIAHEMLRIGRPEVHPDDVPNTIEDRRRLHEDVTVLAARGVGVRQSGGTFSFFHQTFFEYAAALDLLDNPAALRLTAKRLWSHPDDTFLGAVLEQLWICALRHPALRSEAEHLISESLYAEDAPDVLRRIAIRVAAGSAATPGVRKAIGTTLGTADISLVKEYLRRRPRPGRAWEDVDTDILGVLRARGGAPWFAAVDLCQRAYRSYPQEAAAGLRSVVERLDAPFPDDRDLDHSGTQSLFRDLASEDPALVVELLARVHEQGSVRRDRFLQHALPILSRFPEDMASRAADLADAWSVPVGVEVMHAHADLHRRALAQTPEGDWRGILDKAACDLDLIADGGIGNTSRAAYLWGLCQALDTWDDPVKDDAVLDLLFEHASPRVHAELHHGWLAQPANRSNRVRERLAARMADGLPASRVNPASEGARWADSIRRLLGNRFLRHDARHLLLTQLSESRGAAADDISDWLDPEALLHVLIPAACCNFAPAWKAIDALNEGDTGKTDSTAAIGNRASGRIPADAP